MSANGQRRDIQGMRAVAVLAVLLSHATLPGFKGGYVGVDVFFVISGFLITGVLAREVASTGRVSIAEFYARRARRILPASSVVLLAVIVAGAAVYTAGDLAEVLTGVRWSALFGENIHLANAQTDYFAQNSFISPVQHFWSLAVEEQFYLLWPMLIGAVAAWTTRHGRRTRPGHQLTLRRAGTVVAGVSIASFAWSIVDTGTSPQSAYYSTFTRAWELGVGALLALGAHTIAQLPDRTKAACSWGGLIAIVTAVHYFDSTTAFPGYAAALPVLGAALVLAGGIDGPTYGAQALLGVRPMRFVGDISYSLYLWHWPILIMTPVYLDHPVSTRGRIGLLLAATLISWLSYRYIETPFRTVSFFKSGRLRALALWPSAVAVLLVGAAVIQLQFVNIGPAQATTGTNAASGARSTPASLMIDVKNAAVQAGHSETLPSAMVPSLADLFDDVTQPQAGCAARDAATIKHKLCPSADTTSTRTIVVWGDSHAGMWMKPLRELAAAAGYKVVLFYKASCVPSGTLQYYKGKAYKECLEYQTWALHQIQRIAPERVILSGALGAPLLDPTTQRKLSDENAATYFESSATATLRKLKAIAPTVDIISDITVLPRDSGRCLASRSATRDACLRPRNAVVTQRSAAWKRAAAATGATYVDMVPWFCQNGVCPVVVGNLIVYRDTDHVTETYAEVLKPVLADRLRL
ncbi:MAG: acyltransferase family protein [Allobranchiibius sp.]